MNGTWVLVVDIRSLATGLNHWHITKKISNPYSKLASICTKKNKTSLKTVLLSSVDLHLWIFQYSDVQVLNFRPHLCISTTGHNFCFSLYYHFHLYSTFTRKHHSYIYLCFGASNFLWSWHHLLLSHQVTAMIN